MNKLSKVCSKCGIDKPLEEYHTNNSKKDKKQSSCKECLNKQNRKYKRSLETSKRYNRQAHKMRKHRYYSILDKYADKICSSCGYTSKYWVPFDFHHVDKATKKYELSSMVRHTEENIKNEINKCIVLCSNCHRILHYEETLNG